MTPKVDELFKSIMEGLADMGKGMLATQGGGSGIGGASTSMTTPKNPSPAVKSPANASSASNISGQPKTTNNSNAPDFNQLLSDPDDNKAATSIIQHLTQNNIDFNDPKFASTPEGIAIGQRISQNPKFADALNAAQETLIQQAQKNAADTFAK